MTMTRGLSNFEVLSLEPELLITESMYGEIQSALSDELVYRNYKYNRLAAPGTTPEQWTLIYGVDRVPALERRFQLDKERSV